MQTAITYRLAPSGDSRKKAGYVIPPGFILNQSACSSSFRIFFPPPFFLLLFQGFGGWCRRGAGAGGLLCAVAVAIWFFPGPSRSCSRASYPRYAFVRYLGRGCQTWGFESVACPCCRRIHCLAGSSPEVRPLCLRACVPIPSCVHSTEIPPAHFIRFTTFCIALSSDHERDR